jgi:hypothetical protein
VVIALLLALRLFQTTSALPPETRPDLQQVLHDSAQLSSLKVRYRAEGQVIVLDGDGHLVVQSDGGLTTLHATCKGRVSTSEIQQVLGMIISEQFYELPRKTYMLMDADDTEWRKLRVHSITIATSNGIVQRDFAAGEYEGKAQAIPEKFALIENAIVSLKLKAVPAKTPCTIEPLDSAGPASQ